MPKFLVPQSTDIYPSRDISYRTLIYNDLSRNPPRFSVQGYIRALELYGNEAEFLKEIKSIHHNWYTWVVNNPGILDSYRRTCRGKDLDWERGTVMEGIYNSNIASPNPSEYPPAQKEMPSQKRNTCGQFQMASPRPENIIVVDRPEHLATAPGNLVFREGQFKENMRGIISIASLMAYAVEDLVLDPAAVTEKDRQDVATILSCVGGADAVKKFAKKMHEGIKQNSTPSTSSRLSRVFGTPDKPSAQGNNKARILFTSENPIAPTKHSAEEAGFAAITESARKKAMAKTVEVSVSDLPLVVRETWTPPLIDLEWQNPVKYKQLLDSFTDYFSSTNWDSSAITASCYETASDEERRYADQFIKHHFIQLQQEFGATAPVGIVHDLFFTAAHVAANHSFYPSWNEGTWYFAFNKMRDSSGRTTRQSLLQKVDWPILYYIFKGGCSTAWRLLVEPGNIRDAETVRLLPKAEDLSFIRLYVGQSVNINGRIRQHQNHFANPNQNSLLYTIARQPNRMIEFFSLGTADDTWAQAEDKAEWLNIGEQFWSVLLQTLQPTALDEWMPAEIARATVAGLNVALPIHQSEGDRAKKGFATLFKSDDPEIREYAVRVSTAAGELGRQSQRQNGFRDLVIGNRNSARSNQGKYWRNADPALGDAPSMEVICATCMDPAGIRMDTMPTYTITSGIYVARGKKWCVNCCKRDGKDKTTFKPTGSVSFVRGNMLHKIAL
ncbi:hypothetical protein PT974_00210 [Cladobotryum mycophilum]|uniref:Uncharacterized protein n=1 Tax=Cladobotryum mycophilum TaxID=491253 RepID=A0ABR0T1J1_9HYPO